MEMDKKNGGGSRSVELYPGTNGKLQTEWRLTDTKLIDAVKLTVPPIFALPIVFVPGIMGSNLCDLRGKPVWLLNSTRCVPVELAADWSRRAAGARQALLHPRRTQVYRSGNVPLERSMLGYDEREYIRRGWGEISEVSYHDFLVWLDRKLNLERNPARWEDFSHESMSHEVGENIKLARSLPPGLIMKMCDLPDASEKGCKVDPITSDELLKRSKFSFPIYAFGYNWLASNADAAKSLSNRVNEIIAENNVKGMTCREVILVTHSMGGLVARACCQLPDMAQKIVGVVHGVMPAIGAPVAYRRCKVGMQSEDFGAGLVIGMTGKEVTAVFAQAPGALQLLPSDTYGKMWLELTDPRGKKLMSLPSTDPYKEIYLEREKWWGLVSENWLKPDGGISLDWDEYVKNIKFAKSFHFGLAGKYHRNSFVFYGGGPEKTSFSKVSWDIAKGMIPTPYGVAPPLSEISGFDYGDIRTNGSNGVYIGGQRTLRTVNRGDTFVTAEAESSHWEIHCGSFDSSGDGTVPAKSGKDPRLSGGMSVRQQFEISGIKHEPVYRNSSVARAVTYYSITKLAAMAKTS
jgi:hypothetical protein